MTLTSRNSSRPPSSNGPSVASSAPAKKPTGRKRGAQSVSGQNRPLFYS